jgi:hypothetical protein
MTSLQQTIKQYFPRPQGHRWLRFSLAALLGTGLTFSAFAQNDDPDDLTVPQSLQNATERTTPPGDPADPDAPRVRVGPDAQQPRIVGRLVSIEGTTLTIEDGDRQVAIQVPAGVKITRNGDRVPLRQLQPNDTVRIERGISPDTVTEVVAASPARSADREPDQELRLQRQRETAQEPRGAVAQDVVPASGGRVWVVMVESEAEVAETGLRPGDVIIVADRAMLQNEQALRGLSSGLFPLDVNAEGQLIISPNAAGVNVRGAAGAAVPTGVNIGVSPQGGAVDAQGRAVDSQGRVIDPRTGRAPESGLPPRSSVGDDNFGPPIGGQQDRTFGPPIGGRQDQTFGPPIGTGNNPNQNVPNQNVPNQGAGQQAPQQQAPQTQQPQQAPPAP